MTSMAQRRSNQVLTLTRSHVASEEVSMPVVSPAQEASPQAGLASKILVPFLEVGGGLEVLSPIYSSSSLVVFRANQARDPVAQLGVLILKQA